MAHKAVFLDRDNTLIEDPGYLNDASKVKLLPGVELALKSMAQAGYRLVVVTNQSAIARGLLTEAGLEQIHAELRRQLAEKGAHLDAIYYCPYHPEGTVEGFALDSDLRKPKPGMLLQAADELDLDLRQSWMVGDSPRDVEAGQRAGCRTIRVRVPAHLAHASPPEEDEDTQADFVVRNLVDAAKLITRGETATRQRAGSLATQGPGDRPAPLATQRPAPAPGGDDEGLALLREIRDHLRRLAPPDDEPFRVTKLCAGVCLMLSTLGLILVLYNLYGKNVEMALGWGMVAVILGVLATALYVMQREE